MSSALTPKKKHKNHAILMNVPQQGAVLLLI